MNTLWLDLYEENGEWNLTETALVNYSRNVGGVLPGVRFTFFLTRKYSYYVLNLIIPFIVIALLGTFVFVLPVESGEKLGFALTILLSMSVVMSTVSEAIPPISTNTCKLSVYVLIVFIISAVETVVTVISCQTNERHEKGYVPGPIIQSIARSAAKVSFYRRPHKHGNENAENNTATPPKNKEAWVESGADTVKQDEKEPAINATMYTVQECAFIFDRVNFFIFMVVKLVLTISVFVVLQVDGSNQKFS
ncbi:hypothetical protein DPMN_013957 [Dreissena polymorpha]|uniref:Neurotransmitter-gated ion-channel transmembrane domain-containing protein n=2 Tax=Dreissena polymorpha TaxID=45954 RepID=A0A9D4S447_DREPO|nr:hypothetical protein DPMN_013957 [Dreissena polymorpha]